MKKIKIAIVGCGAVAHRRYLKGLANQTRKPYILDTVCDIDPKKVAVAQKKYNIPYGCTTFDKILDKNIDVVVVLTRHDQHYAHCKFFLQHGMHVYSEKPLTGNTRQAKQLQALSQKKNLIVGCAPQVMLSSRNRKLKLLLTQKYIGKIAYIRCSGSNTGPAARPDTDYDPIRFYQNGGSLDSLGIYNVATLIRLFGEPKSICALSGIALPNREVLYGPAVGKKFKVTVPDNVVALLEYDNNMYVSFDGSYTVANPPKYDFEIHGEYGSLFVGGFGGKKSIVYKSLDHKIQYVGPTDRSHIKRNLSWGVEKLVESIRKGLSCENGIAYGISVIKTLERIKKSASKHIYT